MLLYLQYKKIAIATIVSVITTPKPTAVDFILKKPQAETNAINKEGKIRTKRKIKTKRATKTNQTIRIRWVKHLWKQTQLHLQEPTHGLLTL